MDVVSLDRDLTYDDLLPYLLVAYYVTYCVKHDGIVPR